MTSNRLYTLFGLITVLALVTVGVLTVPMIAASFNQPAAASAASAEAARLAQRQGEWNAGPALVTDPEIQRFVAYANSLAEQARLAQRQGEWEVGAASPAAMDVENARIAWRANH